MSHPPWLGEQSEEGLPSRRRPDSSKGHVQHGRGVTVWMGRNRLSAPALQWAKDSLLDSSCFHPPLTGASRHSIPAACPQTSPGKPLAAGGALLSPGNAPACPFITSGPGETQSLARLSLQACPLFHPDLWTRSPRRGTRRLQSWAGNGRWMVLESFCQGMAGKTFHFSTHMSLRNSPESG